MISENQRTGPDKAGNAMRRALNDAAAAGANGLLVISSSVDWARRSLSDRQRAAMSRVALAHPSRAPAPLPAPDSAQLHERALFTRSLSEKAVSRSMPNRFAIASR